MLAESLFKEQNYLQSAIQFELILDGDKADECYDLAPDSAEKFE